MNIENTTKYNTKLIEEALELLNVNGLSIQIKYSRKNTKQYITGTYYRTAKNFPEGKLIRIRINKNNRYPIEVGFKTSEYFEKRDRWGQVRIYQKLRKVVFNGAEELMLGIFLHELSHYLDHIQGKNGKYKQTKADKFAVSVLEKMKLIKEF